MRADTPAEGGLILLYHRVAHPPLDPQLLSVHPDRFSEQLDVLLRVAEPMSLAGMTRAALENRLPRRAVAVTFDDGYADNLLAARPLLAQRDIPATVFIATGYLDARREFWWDALERILLHTTRLPGRVDLSMGGRRVCRALDGCAWQTEEEVAAGRTWNVLGPLNANPRQTLYLELCEMLRPLPLAARDEAMDALAAWSGVARAPRESHRPLRSDEIIRLADGGLIEIGAHTVWHGVLSAQPEAVQRDELTSSKACLEDLLRAPVSSFSYPYGTRRDYTADTVRLVKEAGFERAVSNFRGLVGGRSDRFQLSRLVVRDWGGDEFERRLLEEWSRG